jgi:two-component system LytT family sensor kinase
MNKIATLFLIHILAWIALWFFGLVIVYNSIEFTDTPSLIAISLIFSIWLLISFYAFYFKLVPHYLEKRKYKKFVVYAILTVFIIIPFDTLLWWGIFYFTMSGQGQISFSDFPSVNLIYLYIGSVVGSIFSGGLGTFYRFSMDWFKNQQVKKDLENKNILSELKTLKSKLNPHVLFNTLNNIDTLIQTSPEQASAALSKLSDLLRYVVYETEHEKVPIQKEIDNLQKYIALEKMRIVNPDAVQFITNVSNETNIPPMLFFPFIENGFKHSNLNNTNQKLKISIIEDKSKIAFSCSNTINEYKRNDTVSGMGLELAKKRLDLLFPGTHVLNINTVDNEFHVNLEIQLV